MSPLSKMATMPSSVLFLLSLQRITPAIHALAHERGIMLVSVLERLDAPDSASIQIRTRLSASLNIFTKPNKIGTCRHVEILATMAVHGAWQPSRTHSEADKKAFKRPQGELQAILPLSGDPFRKEGAQFHPLIGLTLPEEHWRDLSEENELRSEND